MEHIKKILSFNGVASRREWWIVYGTFWAVLIVEAQIEILVVGEKDEPSTFFIVLMLLFMWPLFATQIRRWHDRGKSGCWCLINIIPFVGWVWAFVELGFLPSKATNT